MPEEIVPSSVMGRLLDSVNGKLNTSYNSMLVSRYRDKNCILPPHKDNEKCLDPGSPISTLSLGSTVRRLGISTNARGIAVELDH